MNDDDMWDTILGNGGGDNGGSATQLTGILGNVGSSGSPPPDPSSSVNLAPWNPAGIGGDSITPLLLPRLQGSSAAPGFSPPPGSPAPINLSSWSQTGLGGDTLAMLLPQLDNTSAPSATLSPSLASTPTGNAPLSSLFETGLGGDVIASMLPQRQDTSAAFLSPSSLQPPSALYDPNPPAPTMGQLAVMLGVPPEVVAAIGDQAERQAIIDVGSKAVLGPATEAILPEIGIPREIARAAGTTIDIANHISEPSDEQYIQDAPDKALFKYLNDAEFQAIPSAAKAWIP